MKEPTGENHYRSSVSGLEIWLMINRAKTWPHGYELDEKKMDHGELI